MLFVRIPLNWLEIPAFAGMTIKDATALGCRYLYRKNFLLWFLIMPVIRPGAGQSELIELNRWIAQAARLPTPAFVAYQGYSLKH